MNIPLLGPRPAREPLIQPVQRQHMRVLVILPVLEAKETRVEPYPDRAPGQAHDSGVPKRVGVDIVAFGFGRDGLARGGELSTVVSSVPNKTA